MAEDDRAPARTEADDDVDDGGSDSVDGFLRRVAHVSALPLGQHAAFGQPTIQSPPPAAPGEAIEGDSLPLVSRDSYTIVAEYGRGGMGRVLVARDKRLHRRVAIKELFNTEAHAQDRFVREALITARLQHPAIVPVFEAGRWPGGEPFYAMKLVAGRPFSIVIDETPALDQRLALLRVVITVAEAIAYAHSQRIIHRDLKPDNVLVGEFGETVVIDWGLAKHLDLDQPAVEPLQTVPPRQLDPSLQVTVAGSIVGTPGFMAYEQAAGLPANERSDVYAIGSMIYTLLAGRPPYDGVDGPDVVRATLAGPPPPLAERQPGVPVDLLAIVAKAMARQPADRYADAKELAADLNRFTTGQLVNAHRYSRGQRVRRFLRRYRLPVAVALAGFGLFVVTGVAGVRGVVRERDHAQAERNLALVEKAAAEAARKREIERVDQLLVADARAAIDRDPTLTLALLKRLRAEAQLWRDARVLAARAVARHEATAIFPGRVAAFAPDASLLASADAAGRVRVFGRDGSAVELAGQLGVAHALAFSPDGARLAVGGTGGARLYDVAARRALPLEGALGDVTALAVSADGTRFAFAGGGGVRIWDRDGHARSSVETRGPVSQLVFSGGANDRLLVRDRDGVILADGARSRRWPLRGDGPIVVNHRGTALAASGEAGVKLQPLDGGAARVVGARPALALAFAPDDDELAICAADGSTGVVRLSSGKTVDYSHAGEACRDTGFSRDGRSLVATRGSLVRLWDRPTAELRKLRGHELDVTSLQLSADGQWLLSAAVDDTVRLWSIAEPGQPPLSLPADARLALVPNGRAVVAGLGDGSVVLVGGVGRTLGRHLGPVTAVAVAGDHAASAASDGVALHTLADGSSRTITSEAAARVALSADGRHLAVVTREGLLQTVALDRATPPRTLGVLAGGGGLALAPDGNVIAAAAGNSRMLLLFDGAGAQTRSVELEQRVIGLGFVDRDLLAVAGPAGALELLYVPTGEHWALSSGKSDVVALAAGDDQLLTLFADGRVQRHPVPPSDSGRLREWLERMTRAHLDNDDRLAASGGPWSAPPGR